VAVAARGRIIVSGFQGEAMHAGGEAFGLPGVATPTVHQSHGFVIIGMFGGDIRMTTDAIVGFVCGQFQLRRIDEQGNRLAGGIGLEQGVIPVAIEAITVLHAGKNRHDCEQDQGNQQRTSAFHPPIFRVKPQQTLHLGWHLFAKF
jgi:hypothetical protein